MWCSVIMKMFSICSGNKVESSHMCVLSAWNVVTAIKEPTSKILFNFDLFIFKYSHMASGYHIWQCGFRVIPSNGWEIMRVYSPLHHISHSPWTRRPCRYGCAPGHSLIAIILSSLSWLIIICFLDPYYLFLGQNSIMEYLSCKEICLYSNQHYGFYISSLSHGFWTPKTQWIWLGMLFNLNKYLWQLQEQIPKHFRKWGSSAKSMTGGRIAWFSLWSPQSFTSEPRMSHHEGCLHSP